MRISNNKIVIWNATLKNFSQSNKAFTIGWRQHLHSSDNCIEKKGRKQGLLKAPQKNPTAGGS